MQTFGDPHRFQISAGWLQDPEPRERLPKMFGWTMGELRIIVGGVSLTDHVVCGEPRGAIQWYLGPVVAWMLDKWKWLLHEEAFTWSTDTGESAAFTVEADLERYIGSEFPGDAPICKQVIAWWTRHALRSADPSALFPHVYIRRVEDSIEVSWLDKQPEFPPEGFELKLTPGVALLSVEEVAKPLWDFLNWAIDSARPATRGDQEQLDTLRAKLDAVRQMRADELEAAHVADDYLRGTLERVRASYWQPDRKMLAGAPVVTELDMPVLMFGGLNVNINEPDVRALTDVLLQQRGLRESEKLLALVESPSIYAYLKPYVHGYELAYQVRESLGIDPNQAFIDIEAIVTNLGISILARSLETEDIRGVGIAGEAFGPAIVVNESHRFNLSLRGRRFTLAHEFCHILFDRSRAKRLSHISGPWASGRVEKRANAFAAMLLVSPHALEREMREGMGNRVSVKKLASTFGVGALALKEHLRNLDLI